MKKGQNTKLWGIPGKLQKLYSPAKFQGERIIPLNDNPLDAWDTKRSKYRRRELIPREQQMDGINESSLTPIPSLTPSVTPSITPTQTITPTNTPTPSSTPIAAHEIWNTNNRKWENDSQLWNA